MNCFGVITSRLGVISVSDASKLARIIAVERGSVSVSPITVDREEKEEAAALEGEVTIWVAERVGGAGWRRAGQLRPAVTLPNDPYPMFYPSSLRQRVGRLAKMCHYYIIVVV